MRACVCVLLYLERDLSARRQVPGLELVLAGPDSVPDDLESGLVASLNGHFPRTASGSVAPPTLACRDSIPLVPPTLGAAWEVWSESKVGVAVEGVVCWLVELSESDIVSELC